MKATHVTIVGLHAASATMEKRKWQILKLGPQRVERSSSKYGHAIYCWKAPEERNNFDKRTIGQKGNRKEVQKF